MEYIKPILKILLYAFVIWCTIDVALTISGKIKRKPLRIIVTIAGIMLFLAFDWYVYGDSIIELIK